MEGAELRTRYRSAIARIVAAAIPGDRPVVDASISRSVEAPEKRENLQFMVALESDGVPFGLVSGPEWHGKLDQLVIGAEELASSESMQAKLADALDSLHPDYPKLGRVVEFIRDELIAKEGGYGDI